MDGLLENKTFYLVLCGILVVILIACIIALVRIYNRLMKRNETLRESIENLSRFNDKLRMDRHDYLNHLQV
ncbi:MAG: Spo0B domain-containing protein, partial [Lachnospiraceae bacterium]|nr:Spo0B domain-containing protein [Lachnospiraceae bacterium]